MAEEFNPYHRWLGIPPEEQPPHHYRLLGLVPFESDMEVIRDAAERQMAHVRRYTLGKHQELSQRVLNELGAAKNCLMDAERKAHYDAHLRSKLSNGQSSPVPATPAARPAQHAAPQPQPRSALPGQPPAARPPAAPVLATPPRMGRPPAAQAPRAIVEPASVPHARPLPPVPPEPYAFAPEPAAVADKSVVQRVEALVAARSPQHASHAAPRKRKSARSSGFGIMLIAGGATALVAVAVGAVIALSGGSKPAELRLEPVAVQTVTAGEALQVRMRLMHPEAWGNNVRFTLEPGAPAGAAIDPQTGELGWKPDLPGFAKLTVRATSLTGEHLTHTVDVAVDVKPAPVKPAVAPEAVPPKLEAVAARQVDQGSEVSVSVPVADPEHSARPLRYALTGEVPPGATIDMAGQLTWTPQSPGQYTLQVEVIDAQNRTAKTTVAVEVRGVRKGPKLDYVSQESVAAGGRLEIPIGIHAGDTPASRLRLSLDSAPDWMQLDAGSSRLICTPGRSRAHQRGTGRIRVTDDGAPPLSDEQEVVVQVLAAAPRPIKFGTLALPSGATLQDATFMCPPLEACGRLFGKAQKYYDFTQIVPGDPRKNILDQTVLGQRCGWRLGSGGAGAVLDGPTVGFYPDGSAHVLVNYKMGKRSGEMFQWDENKRPVYYARYAQDKKDGATCLFSKGSPWLVQEWNAGAMNAQGLVVFSGDSATVLPQEKLNAEQQAEFTQASAALAKKEDEFAVGSAALKQNVAQKNHDDVNKHRVAGQEKIRQNGAMLKSQNDAAMNANVRGGLHRQGVGN